MRSGARLAFRVDGSHIIGTGHVMRCLTLAQEARHRGAEVIFFCRQHPGHFVEFIRDLGFQVVTLPMIVPSSVRADLYADWLGVSWEDDVIDMQAHQNLGPFDWLVVDHYALDARWERAVGPMAHRLLVVDDLADRPHFCNILLDQNRVEGPQAYVGLCPPGCRFLVGPDYALLRSEFVEARKVSEPRGGGVNNLLVFYGGVDATNETSKALRVLKRLALPWRIEVVIGMTNPHRTEIEAEVAGMHNTKLHIGSSEMAQLMANADLSLGAAGGATWERAAVGLPVVATVVAENQKIVGAMIAEKQLGIYMGEARHITDDDIQKSVLLFLSRPEMVQDCSKAGWMLVDARGSSRVLDCMGAFK